MLTDPRLKGILGRGAHRQEIDHAIEAWLDVIGDADAALRLPQDRRVPCAPALSVPEVMAHPHMQGAEPCARLPTRCLAH